MGKAPEAPKEQAEVAFGPRGTTKPVKWKTGRPRIGEGGKTLKALKPWVKMDMSRRTWFRRQAEQRAKEKQ